MSERPLTLRIFATRHAALLNAMAATWAPAARFTWHDPDGRLLYTSGSAADGGTLSAWLIYGILTAEGAPPLQQPMLDAQAALLQAAVERESEIEVLTDELMHTQDRLAALFELSAASRAGWDMDNFMHACVRQVAELTGAACAVLAVRDNGSPQVFAFPEPTGPLPTRALLAALERGEPAIANSPAACATLCGGPIEDLNRMVFVPIAIGGRRNAVLGALNKPVDFVSGDLKLIAALADAAETFIERERAYQRELSQARLRRELEIASEIQSRLLPRDVPTVPGVQVVARSRPAGEVGGDFFDVQTLPGNALAIALGDAAGKGVPAALIMAMARVLLRVGLQTTRSPEATLKLLNAGLANDLSSADSFLTLFVATFDPATGQLRAVNCGQSPVLIFRDGVVHEWEADGPPIGVLPDPASAEREQRLAAGDVLVLLSDGFNEARDPGGRRIGIGPLADVVRREAGQDAAAIAAALQRCVETYERGSAPTDDQTLIVMKVE